MTISDLVAALTGEGTMTSAQAAASFRHRTRSLVSHITSTRHADARRARISLTGCPPNGSSGTTIDSRSTLLNAVTNPCGARS